MDKEQTDRGLATAVIGICALVMGLVVGYQWGTGEQNPTPTPPIVKMERQSTKTSDPLQKYRVHLLFETNNIKMYRFTAQCKDYYFTEKGVIND